MQLIVFPFVERNGIRPRIEKHGRHATSASVAFSVVHQGPASTTATHRRVDDEVVNMQVWSARQRVNGPHPQDPDDLSVQKGRDKLVT